MLEQVGILLQGCGSKAAKEQREMFIAGIKCDETSVMGRCHWTRFDQPQSNRSILRKQNAKSRAQLAKKGGIAQPFEGNRSRGKRTGNGGCRRGSRQGNQ